MHFIKLVTENHKTSLLYPEETQVFMGGVAALKT